MCARVHAHSHTISQLAVTHCAIKLHVSSLPANFCHDALSQRSKNKPVIVHRPFGHYYTPASSLFAHLKRGQKAVSRSPRAENWTKHKNKTAASERLSSVEGRSHTHKCLRHSRVSAKVKRKHTAVLFCRSSDSTVTEIKT